MTADPPETVPVRDGDDIVRVRRAARERARRLGFGLTDQTRIMTAASELARNALRHGGGGQVTLERVEKEGRVGIRMTFDDQGPGIADVEAAMADGFSTARGLGLGLGGARRLADEFEVTSTPEARTRVVVVRWLR